VDAPRWTLAFQEPPASPLILLDTNALIWLHRGHRRALPLRRLAGRLYASPASLLEVQVLLETGRVDLRAGSVTRLLRDDRWLLDDPPAVAWFERSIEIGWSDDPFDRLLVGHASLRNWRLATGDARLVERLGPRQALEL
jgi:PIN domain nuclease of toxin-antitoxin system